MQGGRSQQPMPDDRTGWHQIEQSRSKVAECHQARGHRGVGWDGTVPLGAARHAGAVMLAKVLKAMDEGRLDALVYPSWNNPPRLIGDLNTPHGNNSPRVSPPTGFPAIG